MNKVLYDEWSALSGKAAIDKFFENYEKDPCWLAPDGNIAMEDISKIEGYNESLIQAKAVSAIERRIANNLDNVTDILTEVMLDPAFERTGMAMLKELNICRKKLEDILAQKKEEIMVLTYGFVPWKE